MFHLLHGPEGRSASRPCLSGEDGMGRGSENLLLARASRPSAVGALRRVPCLADYTGGRSEEHTSELQSLMRISYAVFCLKKKKNNIVNRIHILSARYNKHNYIYSSAV